MKMYRLLKLRKLSSCNSQAVSYQLNNSFFTRTCAFCNHNFVLKAPKDIPPISFAHSTRLLSTNAKTIMHAPSKKKKRKLKRKYAELLEVTEDSSSQKKASVSNLTPRHLSLLAEQPDVDLNEPFQLRKRKIQPSIKVQLSVANLKSHSGALVFIPPEMNAESVNNTVLENSIPVLHHVQNLHEEDNCQNSLLTEKNILTTNSSTDQMLVSSETVTILKNLPQKNSEESIADDIAHELNMSIDDPELRVKFIQDLNNSSHQDISTLKRNVMEDHFDFQESEVDNVEVVSEEQNPKEKNVKKGKKSASAKKALYDETKRKEIIQESRIESLTRGLVSYMDVCVNCGLLNRALSTLSHYRFRRRVKKEFFIKLSDVKPYNILLHGFAGKGNLNKVKEILRMMDEDNIKWSLQTYAAVFECLGRIPSSVPNTSLLQKWMCKLKDEGWTLNDVIVKPRFLSDQKENVLNAICYIVPDFEPEYPPPDTCYSCKLLHELNNTTKTKIYKSPADGVINRTDLIAAAKEQYEIETCDHVKVKSIEKREEPSQDELFYREKLSETEANWRNVLMQSLKREMENLSARHKFFEDRTRLNLYGYLRVLDPSVYVELIMKEIRRLAEGSETFSPSTSQLYRDLGWKVLSRYEVQCKRNHQVLNKIENIYEKYCDWYTNPEGPAKNTREQWQLLLHTHSDGPSVDIEKKDWPGTVLACVGQFLFTFILRDIKIDVNILKPNSEKQHLLPAFYTLFRNHGRVLKEEIKPHPALARLFRGAALEHLVFDVNLVPMLSPPIPWISASNGVGGYLMTQADLVRLPYLAVQQKLRMEETAPNNLYPSLDALNQLGSIPWVVNEPVLDVVIEVFNQGGSHRLDIPQPPSACPQPIAVTSNMSREERMKAFQERIMLRRRRSEMYSLWCDSLYRLSLANHYRKRVFWLPHNMDFRGRVYPCPPHLNHLGSDMARSLLQFAQGQPLGPKGFDWLMIHLINLTGLMKRDPVEERLVYAMSILPDILDSADKPLTGKMWWAGNEDPWQVLATCMEIARALRSGNPETYVSRFPVHQDGSCNGLQHYAALGRDKAGAESVNLAPSHCPQDVYSCVVALVERERSKDAAAGVKIAQILDGFVRRKVIKQTVMTTVYGVTRYGARLQIARQLKDIEDFPKESIWHGSSYLVGKTFESLREMFTSTKEIQDWFTECARQISQICGENVEWVTPLGLPVVQPYVRFSQRPYYLNKSSKLNEHFVMDMFEKPNVMKQKNAFPPNFIHSLDSSHMMLTSLFCEREGIIFVSVHDCYWTHPCTVDKMNKICREQFVALHSEPILEDLSKFLIGKFGYSGRLGDARAIWLELNKRLKSLPPKGDFDLKNVLKSVYFFS